MGTVREPLPRFLTSPTPGPRPLSPDGGRHPCPRVSSTRITAPSRGRGNLDLRDYGVRWLVRRKGFHPFIPPESRGTCDSFKGRFALESTRGFLEKASPVPLYVLGVAITLLVSSSVDVPRPLGL